MPSYNFGLWHKESEPFKSSITNFASSFKCPRTPPEETATSFSLDYINQPSTKGLPKGSLRWKIHIPPLTVGWPKPPCSIKTGTNPKSSLEGWSQNQSWSGLEEVLLHPLQQPKTLLLWMWTLSHCPNAKPSKEKSAASTARKLDTWPTIATRKDATTMTTSEGDKEEDTEETTVGDSEETGGEEGTTSTEIVPTIKDRKISHTTIMGRHPLSKTDLPKSDALPLLWTTKKEKNSSKLRKKKEDSSRKNKRKPKLPPSKPKNRIFKKENCLDVSLSFSQYSLCTCSPKGQ